MTLLSDVLDESSTCDCDIECICIFECECVECECEDCFEELLWNDIRDYRQRTTVVKSKLGGVKKTNNPFNIPNYEVRDFQRARVYTAEANCSFWKEPFSLEPQEVLEIVKAISSWADIHEPRFFSKRPLQMEKQAPANVAFAAPDLVCLPSFACSKPFICHEMAHVISYQKGPNDHHGPNFVKVYLDLIYSFMGQAESDELRSELSKTKVKVGA